MLLLTGLGRGECSEGDWSEVTERAPAWGPSPHGLPNLLLGKHEATLSRTKQPNGVWVLGLAGYVLGRPL